MKELYRYFHLNKDIFAGITDIEFSDAEDLCRKLHREGLSARCYDVEYVKRRLSTEEIIRSEFIKKGGCVKKNHPYYLTLGNCDSWFYNKKGCFGSINFSITDFDVNSISFTYGDSIPTYMEQFQDGKEYRKNVYTYREILEIVKKYGYPQNWNSSGKRGPETYIEVQVWDEKPIFEFRPQNIINQNNEVRFYEKFSDAIIRANPKFNVQQNCIRLFDYIKSIKHNNLWNWYCNFIEALDKKDFCLDPVHGVEHALKCSLLAFIMGDMIDMTDGNLKALIIAATYHDIGRKYNIEGKSHGEISALKLKESLFSDCPMEYSNVQFAIRNHEKRNISSKNELLLRLQDVDSLDYMRLGFGKFNSCFLVTKEARALVRACLELNICMFYNKEIIKKIIKGEAIYET